MGPLGNRNVRYIVYTLSIQFFKTDLSVDGRGVRNRIAGITKKRLSANPQAPLMNRAQSTVP